jgi:CRP-like cAMP-binding protein
MQRKAAHLTGPHTGAMTSTSPDLTLWLRKLDPDGRFDGATRDLLSAAIEDIRPFGAHQTLFREGDPPADTILILDGIACRSKELPSGERAIVAFLLPGDLCNGDLALFPTLDHSLRTLTSGRAAYISQACLQRLEASSPALALALRRAAAQEDAIAREWMANLAQRSGRTRTAHLLCELFVRLRRVGLIHGFSGALPLTQQDLSDATGLSVVHLNRVLQGLRRSGLLRLGRGMLEIVDWRRLAAVAELAPDYVELLEAA